MIFEKGFISIPECYRTYREIAQKHHPIWPDSDGPTAGSGMSGVSRSPENQALLDAYRRSERLRLNVARRACLKELSRLIEHVRVIGVPGSPWGVDPWMFQDHPRHPASPAFFDLETGLVGYWRREPCPLDDLEIYDATNPANERIVMSAPIHLLRSDLEPVEELDAWRGGYLEIEELQWIHAGDRDDDEDRAIRALEHEKNFWGSIHDWRIADPEQTARFIMDFFGRYVLIHHIDGVNRKYLNRLVVDNLKSHGRTDTTEYAKKVRDELVKSIPEITRGGRRLKV